jgi:hypothetical protein
MSDIEEVLPVENERFSEGKIVSISDGNKERIDEENIEQQEEKPKPVKPKKKITEKQREKGLEN